MSSILESLLSTDKGQVAIAGIAGASVSAVMEWTGVVSGIRRLFVGATTAYFMSPVGLPLFAWAFGQVNIPAEQAASVGGFVTGVAGVILVEIFLGLMRIRKLELARDSHAED